MKSIVKKIILVFSILFPLVTLISITAFNNSRNLIEVIEQTEISTVNPLRYFSNLNKIILETANLALTYSPNSSLRNASEATIATSLVSINDIETSKRYCEDLKALAKQNQADVEKFTLS